VAPRDVITMLTDQHEQIRSLFSEAVSAEGDARRDAFERLVRLLAVHETAEEEVVHPAVTFAGAPEVATARTVEEAEAKRMLAQLETGGVKHPLFVERLTLLQAAVLRHAGLEEAEAFPRLRSFYPEPQLRAMAVALRAAEAIAPTHAHRLGPNDPVGHMIFGPSIALADRVRDAWRRAARTREKPPTPDRDAPRAS
jgi:hemerythrin superfamily protein